MNPAEEARFWGKVVRGEPDDCWEWQTYRDKDGYGEFWLGRKRRAHVVAWEWAHGPVPAGLIVRHYVCDNPPCVNPRHLRAGTISDNAVDAVRSGLHPETRKRHCPQGHPYDVRNTLSHLGKWRRCRECHRIRENKRYHSRKVGDAVTVPCSETPAI